VVVAVVVQLGFAVAFLVDADQTNRVYDALAGHRVAITGQVRGCAEVVTTRGGGTRFCRVGYDYQGQQFSALLPSGQTTTVYVDPDDPSMRMNKVAFDKGSEETTGDLVLAGVLVLGAISVTAVHVVHLRRGRATSMRVRSDDPRPSPKHPAAS
jgi:hypothetical protein